MVNLAQSSAIRLKRCIAKRLADVLDADISTAAFVACDERTTRWDMEMLDTSCPRRAIVNMI